MAQENMLDLRRQLLSVYGIGPETADTILTYALDKPSFIIDEYAKRFVQKYKLTNKLLYGDLKEFFEWSLPSDLEIYRNYHILMIIDQKGKEPSMMKTI
jgi:endonuclease-3 related protein